MPYVIPTFNLAVDIYRQANFPPGTGPDVSTTGNLTPGRRVSVNIVSADWQMFLLLPKLTDIQVGDWVDCPALSSRIYAVTYVDDIGKGFANEHRFAVLQAKFASWPVPYP